MSNAQDLLSILSNAGAARPSRGGLASSTSGNTETSILSFKAGKMTTKLQPNGKFMVEPDARRGELHVVWFHPGGASTSAAAASTGHVKLEWKDRRTKTTVTTIPIFGNDSNNAAPTFERVNTGREGDRVYLLQLFGDNNNVAAAERHFFWMQDKEDELDEANCISVNLYLSDFNEAHLAAQAISGSPTAAAATATSGSGAATTTTSSLSASGARTVDSMDNAELLRIMQGALGTNGNINDVGGARTTTVPGNASIPTANAGQVDALGNILENLGVPTSTSSLRREGGTPSGERNARISLPGDATAASASSATAAAVGGSGSGGGGLTLADLQGAMAGLATASPPPSATSAGAGIVGPPLSELVSMDIIDESGILDDPSTVERLVALLPENQRSEAMLRENIRSPQVAQCLRRLTSALADEDDAGSFNSIIANFQLNPEDGALAMASGNPIEAFLNCLLRDVERKEGVKKPMMTTMDEEEGAEGDDVEDDGGSGDASGGDDGDVKMDEN
ncbi:hypothetical protein ACHAWU_005861 [Discostella pseudostelligera]|uniref:Pru domain-containing protein n=1 Tax=Discostella pseudostelligera TaxID=259834 RepID=A0ABD3N1Q3_9STRA